jgi:hypothetical protein
MIGGLMIWIYVGLAIALIAVGAIIGVLAILSLAIRNIDRTVQKDLGNIRRMAAAGTRRLLGGSYYPPMVLSAGKQRTKVRQLGSDKPGPSAALDI